MIPTSVSPEQMRRVANWALLALMAIVLTGAAVRLTGSGLGCSDWPTCEEGSLVPDQGGLHSAIEFGNRVFSVVPAAAVIAAVVFARRRVPYVRASVGWAWALVGIVVVQILVGAVVVRTDLLPSAVITHFLLSMVSIWMAVMLIDSTTPFEASVRRPLFDSRITWASRLLVALGVYVIVSGTIVTGTGPHSGDADDPERLTFFLPDVARAHSVGVIVLCSLSVFAYLLARQHSPGSAQSRAAAMLLGAIVVQGAIGYIQYFTGVPALLVGFHIFGSMIFLFALLRMHLSLFEHIPNAAVSDTAALAGAES